MANVRRLSGIWAVVRAAGLAATIGGGTAGAQVPVFADDQPAPSLFPKIAPVVACFREGTDPRYVEAVTTLVNLRNQAMFGLDYHIATRWSGTQGQPRALTWSLVPDGIALPSGIGEPASPSELFAQMDGAFSTQGGRATWINRVQQVFDRWGQLTGNVYTRVRYQNNEWDDGAAWGSAGAANLRGDIRIAMHSIDGEFNVLAYNDYPPGGDMVLDSDDIVDFKTANNQHRFLRNCMMHEHGHGLGLEHTCSTNADIIMAPEISVSFDGPRQDDIRAAQRFYGDPFEPNDTSATAKALGALVNGTPINRGTIPNPPTGTNDPFAALCSIDRDGAVDWYSFTVANATTLTATVTPVGSTYDDSPQQGNGSCIFVSNTNALAVADLVLTVYSSNGTTVLLNRNANGVGLAETGSVLLPAAGTYYIKISEANTPTGSQLYKLDLSGSCATTPVFTQQPASLLVNNGQVASFTVAATNATSYQWRKDGVPLTNDGRISGVTTATLTIAGARSTDAGAYTAVANSTCASTTSQQALLTVLCYANCDGSITPPILNIADYACFQNLYVAGDSRANCDGSTNPPILNIFDFLCFQQNFAAGCQ